MFKKKIEDNCRKLYVEYPEFRKNKLLLFKSSDKYV